MIYRAIKHYKQMIITLEKYAELFDGLPTIMDLANQSHTQIFFRDYYDYKTPIPFALFIAHFNGVVDDGSRYYYHEKGEEIFTKEMGFEDIESLERFFGDYPDIWGNRWGGNFSNICRAYNEGKHDYDYKTLKPIAVSIKFSAVAERLKKILKDWEDASRCS